MTDHVHQWSVGIQKYMLDGADFIQVLVHLLVLPCRAWEYDGRVRRDGKKDTKGSKDNKGKDGKETGRWVFEDGRWRMVTPEEVQEELKQGPGAKLLGKVEAQVSI